MIAGGWDWAASRVHRAFVVRTEVKGDASVLQCRFSPRSCTVQTKIFNQELHCLFWRKSIIVSPYVMDCKTFTTLYSNMCCRSFVSVSGSVTTLGGVRRCLILRSAALSLCWPCIKHKGKIHPITGHKGPEGK